MVYRVVLFLGWGDDVLTLPSVASTQAGYQVYAGDGDDLVNGAVGDDILRGENGNDSLFGAEGNDSIYGGDGNDFLRGGQDDDFVDGEAGDDQVFGNDGNDTLLGGGGRDSLGGGNGNDSLVGGSGADTLRGDGGGDTLNGGTGNDLLIGGAGRDILTGGADADTFRFESIFDSPTGATTRDVITDFLRGVDRIDVSAIDANFYASGDQAFAFIGAGQFSTANTGQIRSEVFLRNDGTGVTLIQADVNGDRVADFEIELRGTFTLTASDFIL